MVLNFQKRFAIMYFAISIITVKGDSFNTFYFLTEEEGLGLGMFFQGFRVQKNHITLIWIIPQPETEKASVPGVQLLSTEVGTSTDLVETIHH